MPPRFDPRNAPGFLGGTVNALLGIGSLRNAVKLWAAGFVNLPALTAAGAVFLLTLGGVLFAYMRTINKRLTVLQNDVERAFADIDTLLNRKFDVLANLAKVCRTPMRNEWTVLKAIDNVRGDWRIARDKKAKLEAAHSAQRMLKSLFAMSTSHPALRADQTFLQLQGALAELDGQISVRCELYNSAASLLNTQIQQIPDAWFADLFGFRTQPVFTDPTK
jgi:LemA protein